jgi:hypothetical protein
MVEIKPYEIGQWYEVPCVFWKWLGRWDWWPIQGPMHNDQRLIGFPHDHYHVDHRFLTVKQFQRGVSYAKFRGINAANVYPLHSTEKPHVQEVGWPQIPTMKRKRCQRSWPEFPVRSAAINWLSRLEDAYDCALMKHGICPHQGAPLSGLEVKDGMVTCTLHGLRWNVETGAMVRHTQKVAAP